MAIYFSKSADGFYNSDIVPEDKIPNDKIHITEQEHTDLMIGQEAGMEIYADDAGKPNLRVRVQPTMTAEDARQKREALLIDSDWTQMPDAPVDKAAWATYRQALRDVPSQSGFPDAIVWPTKP